MITVNTRPVDLPFSATYQNKCIIDFINLASSLSTIQGCPRTPLSGNLKRLQRSPFRQTWSKAAFWT